LSVEAVSLVFAKWAAIICAKVSLWLFKHQDLLEAEVFDSASLVETASFPAPPPQGRKSGWTRGKGKKEVGGEREKEGRRREV
jgi:hypothetical protein